MEEEKGSSKVMEKPGISGMRRMDRMERIGRMLEK